MRVSKRDIEVIREEGNEEVSSQGSSEYEGYISRIEEYTKKKQQ